MLTVASLQNWLNDLYFLNKQHYNEKIFTPGIL